MKTNTKKVATPVFTAEGGPAKNINPTLQLRRSVLATMLWEDSFYEDGVEIGERIASLVGKVPARVVADLAVELRSKGKLRHVPLKIVREMARIPSHKHLVAETLYNVIQRADELAEFVSLYWQSKKEPLSAQVKKGLARAFTKFSAFDLSKYNRENKIKLRDVLFLCHAKPKDEEQAAVWKDLINDKLETADTWESRLSASQGENKKEVWTDLLKEKKLGALALLRNLRNFKEQGVSEDLVREALKNIKTERVLPFRFISAARYAPNLEPELEEAMYKSIPDTRKLGGKTILLIDVSGSMEHIISGKSEIKRIDAAAALAILAREMFSDVEIYTFSNKVVQVPTRRGFGLRDAIVNSQSHSGTDLGAAVNKVNSINHERLLVFSDEQSHSPVPNPKCEKAYMINVANSQNGVGYGKWTHLDGFSESVLDYIAEFENLD